MDSQLPKDKNFGPHTLVLVCVLSFLWPGLIFFSSPCLAGEVDADMFGLTYHLHKAGDVYNAPLKLDKSGSVVFNPGLGLGYDFRDDIHTEGISAVVHGGLFENCDNHPYSFAGAGARYRKFFYKKNFFETNVLGVLTYGNDSDDKHYKLAPMPYANIGVGHDYGKYLVTYYLSYVPKNSGSDITSSTDMLFLSAAVSF